METFTFIRTEFFTTGDSNGDGIKEIYTFGGTMEGISGMVVKYSLYDEKRHTDWQINFRKGRVKDVHISDLDGDGRGEMIVALVSDSTAWLEIYDPITQEFIKKLETLPISDRDNSGKWDGGFKIKDSVDLDHDGIKEIICHLCAGFDIIPRELIKFSYATGKKLDSFKIAGIASKLYTINIQNTGETIIIFSTLSVDNGYRVDDFTDDQSYLYALDQDFNLLWSLRTASYMNQWAFTVSDIDSDGIHEVIVSRELKGNINYPHRLEVIDLKTGVVQLYMDMHSEINKIFSADMDRDTKKEIIISDQSGSIQILNGRLERKLEYQNNILVILRCVQDFTRNGEKEIVAAIGENKAMMFDEDLQPICERTFSDYIMEAEMISTRETNLLLIYILGKINVVKLHKNFFASGSGKNPLILLAVGLIAGLTLGSAITIFKSKSRSQDRRKIKAKRIYEELLASLTAFGHSGIARSNLERLALYCDAIPDPDDTRFAEYIRRLETIIKTYNDFTSGLLRKLPVLGGKQKELELDLTELEEHTAKIEGLIEQINSSSLSHKSTRKNCKRISPIARNLINLVKEIRRKALSLCSTNVLTAVNSTTSALNEKLKEYGINEIAISARGDLVARVDSECLKTCLEIVIINAAEAMEKSERKELSVTITNQDEYIFIDISDTGYGMDKQKWKSIFERGTTTKGPEHGLGLYHAKNSLEKYEGKILVKSSKPGEGTTITMRLHSTETGRNQVRESEGKQK